MQKVLLYYKFTPIADPEAVRLWQHALCTSLGLTGRIIISKHGINGTVGGDMAACKKYVRVTKEFAGFKDMEFKWSNGTGDEFPKLSVKARDEVVTFGAPDELTVDENGVVGGGVHLKPGELHKLVEARDDVVFFDGRNSWEADIGRFKDAIVPNVETTKDFLEVIDSGEYDHLKDSPIVTYCTGGIRCEVLSSLMKQRGFNEVYQLDGGIVKYGESFGNSGLWEGSLYVFDNRQSIDFGGQAALVGTCHACGTATNNIENCSEQTCKRKMTTCEDCARKSPLCESHAQSALEPAADPATS
ncbi:rhodanese-related sulfurtransferase [Humidisolicoccus flavus]|uniref:oxygen-dependent tRNA uridine(34) hydroxylase TrhO n=1 Tax=Humidisolicoccus flavus TaxID=3111414 RepID=UPI0032476C1A